MKTQWFQCPLYVDVKYVNKATIGNDLVLDNYVNTAISNVRVLKRVPKDSRVPLAESLSDKINDIVLIKSNLSFLAQSLSPS